LHFVLICKFVEEVALEVKSIVEEVELNQILYVYYNIFVQELICGSTCLKAIYLN